MTGYTGRPYSLSPSEASASRVSSASRGQRSSMAGKIDEIGAYIKRAADTKHSGNIRAVLCPTADEWAALSRGRHAVLPSESQLALYANQKMREIAATRGGMRQAYFAVAKSRLLHPPAPRAPS